MSQENVEAFKRGMAASERRDIDALLNEFDADVEWQPLLPVLLGGETTMYRGRQGVRDLFREVDAAFAEFHVEVFELRDLGDRVIASGRMHGRGKASGAETDSPLAYLVDFRDGKAFRVHSFRELSEALEAAGLRE
jgi:ketosteroid isomerase-like protein